MAIQAGETWFLDTNILLSATNESRPSHAAIHRLFREANEQGGHLAMSGQIAREYLVIATRPIRENGLGVNLSDALKNIEEFCRATVFLHEGASVHNSLVTLLKSHPVSGKRIHDANVVATMVSHGITVLVTENFVDFQGFNQVEARSPS